LGKEHRGSVQKAESGGGSWRGSEEVAAIELHATLFRVRMKVIVQEVQKGIVTEKFF
jgi:hypothetical protein